MTTHSARVNGMATLKQAADATDYSPGYLKVLCNDRKIIGARKVGRDWMVPYLMRIRRANGVETFDLLAVKA